MEVKIDMSTEQVLNVKPLQEMKQNGKSCRMSILDAKGLLNMPGQNNCFLNSAVQVITFALLCQFAKPTQVSSPPFPESCANGNARLIRLTLKKLLTFRYTSSLLLLLCADGLRAE